MVKNLCWSDLEKMYLLIQHQLSGRPYSNNHEFVLWLPSSWNLIPFTFTWQFHSVLHSVRRHGYADITHVCKHKIRHVHLKCAMRWCILKDRRIILKLFRLNKLLFSWQILATPGSNHICSLKIRNKAEHWALLANTMAAALAYLLTFTGMLSQKCQQS